MDGAGKRADARPSKNSAEKGGPAGPGNKRKRDASPVPAPPKQARMVPSADAPVQAPQVLKRPAAACAPAPRVLKRPAAAGAAGQAKKLLCPSIRFSSGDLSCAAVEKAINKSIAAKHRVRGEPLQVQPRQCSASTLMQLFNSAAAIASMVRARGEQLPCTMLPSRSCTCYNPPTKPKVMCTVSLSLGKVAVPHATRQPISRK